MEQNSLCSDDLAAGVVMKEAPDLRLDGVEIDRTRTPGEAVYQPLPSAPKRSRSRWTKLRRGDHAGKGT
jgi:hypothetical protein